MAAALGRHEWALVLRLASFRAFLDDGVAEAMDEACGLAPLRLLVGSASTSKHLERYMAWKLDADKVHALIAAESKGMRALERVKKEHKEQDGSMLQLQFYASGKRGILFVNQRRTCLVKVQKLDDHGVDVIAKESKWLAVVNRVSIGPRLLGSGDGYLMCEFLDGGLDAVAFLHHPQVDRTHVVWFLRSVLHQCFCLDMLGINKAEMTHPMRHIIVHRGRVVFVDFEKCTFGLQRRNVTQVCQFIASPRVVAAAAQKGHTMAIDKLRKATKLYKSNPGSKAFHTILQTLHLA